MNYIYQISQLNEKLFTYINIIKRSIKEDDLNITFELTGNKNTFQIKSVLCFACSFYTFMKFYTEPLEGVRYILSLGGDTDTTCKLVCEMYGATYGTKWFPKEWSGCEHEKEFINMINHYNKNDF